MKTRKIIALFFAAAFLFVITACNKGGCPNKIDVEDQELVIEE